MVYLTWMSYRIYCNTRSILNSKRSTFITHLERVFSFEEAKAILTKLKTEHPEATHITYAYRSHQEERTGDDGEVPGTAGKTELKVLKDQDLTDILAVVIRYYGGTPLGISGLIHAYMNSVIEALKTITLCQLVDMEQFIVRLPVEKVDIVRKYNRDTLQETTFEANGFYALMRFISVDNEMMQTLKNQTLGTAQLIEQTHVITEVLVAKSSTSSNTKD